MKTAMRPTLGWISIVILCSVSFLQSCATTSPNIPTTYNQQAQQLVIKEGHRILNVTEDANNIAHYRFYLADFPAANKKYRGAAGASLGNGQIYIDNEIAGQALKNTKNLWTLRLVLAHEIAHEVTGHQPNQKTLGKTFNILNLVGRAMSIVPGTVGWAGSGISWGSYLVGTAGTHLYARYQELEADKLGIEYWKRLGWDCRFWIRRFDLMLRQNLSGDFHHPTNVRLEQSLDVCLPKLDPERIAIERRLSQFEQEEREWKDDKDE